MAEARLGVHPMPGLQRAGFEIDTTIKAFQVFVGKPGLVVYVPAPRYWLRGIRRWLWRGLNKTRVAFHPVPLWAASAITSAVVAGVVNAPSNSWFRHGKLAEVLWKVDSLSPLAQQLPVKFRVGYLAAGTSAVVMLGYAASQRFVLRRLLSYHGWLDRKNQKSLTTKVWGFLIKTFYLNRISHQLNAYQWCLPKLPLPNVQSTINRYLETVAPLLTAEELAEHKKEALEFVKNEAPALQSRLWVKWAISRNYVSGWWLDFVYLRARDPLPINSNWYGITFADYRPTQSQTARAAVAVFSMVRLYLKLYRETFDPHVLAGVAPLCMAQYEYAFATTRVPGHEQDYLDKYDFHESRHVVVLHKGRMFKLPVFSPNTMAQLTPLQLYHAFEGIVASEEPASEAESLMPALTAWGRTEWAQIREELFERHPHNATRLEAIESSIFVVCLDDDEPANWTEEGLTYMCGNGHNRWCDKSFNLVVTKNAKVGVHAEHSWGDAPALAHLMESMMLVEKAREFYNPDGSVKATPQDEAKISADKFQTYPAMRIDFRTGTRILENGRKATADFQQRIADFELHVDVFDAFGKKFVGKNAKVSPDAFIQMAMQLAYFRDQGRFDLTYESSMTRLFRDGRTETIRSMSNESCAFVRAFEAGAPREEVIALLRKACERHQQYTIDTMRGEGVDRHLFALYVVSVGISKPSAFLRSALGRKWMLSTSQVPPKQCSDADHIAAGPDEMYCPNGGFGPVADRGYGVCYNVWDNRFYFNVSTKKSADNTSSKRFHGRICQALRDMAALFDAEKAAPPKQ